MLQTLCTSVRVPNMQIIYAQTTHLLGSHSTEMYISCPKNMSMLIAVLFATDKNMETTQIAISSGISRLQFYVHFKAIRMCKLL